MKTEETILHFLHLNSSTRVINYERKIEFSIFRYLNVWKQADFERARSKVSSHVYWTSDCLSTWQIFLPFFSIWSTIWNTTLASKSLPTKRLISLFVPERLNTCTESGQLYQVTKQIFWSNQRRQKLDPNQSDVWNLKGPLPLVTLCVTTVSLEAWIY